MKKWEKTVSIIFRNLNIYKCSYSPDDSLYVNPKYSLESYKTTFDRTAHYISPRTPGSSPHSTYTRAPQNPPFHSHTPHHHPQSLRNSTRSSPPPAHPPPPRPDYYYPSPWRPALPLPEATETGEASAEEPLSVLSGASDTDTESEGVGQTDERIG